MKKLLLIYQKIYLRKEEKTNPNNVLARDR